MGLWIREPSGTGKGHVPGTVKIFESDAIAPGGAIEEIGRVPLGLQNRKHDNSGVVLVPQPSDSPNDPLVCLWCSIHYFPGIDDLLFKELASMEERPDTFRN